MTAGRERVRLDAPPAVVPRFEPLELTLRLAAPAFDNPFAEAVPTGRFVAPSGRALEVGGFCDADDGGVLRLRFCPDEVGEHSYELRCPTGDGSALNM